MATATVATMSSPPLTPDTPKRRTSNLSLDLSDLPPLSQPAEPSNTLIITNLGAPEIFTAANLENIVQAINAHATIHTFSPLKSFRRIIVSFLTTDDAIAIRKTLDGETILGYRIKIYFGSETKIIDPAEQHLAAPKSDKLFFISPPPSPPMGWEMRNEEPPNTEVHADDLVAALAALRARPDADDALREDVPTAPLSQNANSIIKAITRTRSGSTTIVYDPPSPHLPAIAVEDTTESPADDDDDGSAMTGIEGEKKFVHTSRPPVELME